MNGTSGASWFETALSRLLTMRVTVFARSEALLLARRQFRRFCFILRRRCGRGL